MLASDPPAMKYKSIVKKKDFSRVNLEGVTPTGNLGSSIKRKYPCPIFDGTGGIEALLYVEETFKKLALKLDYDVAEGFDSWELCLADSALEHWENINDTITADDRTNTKFNALILKFYLRYSSTEAREVMYSYLGSEECIKPKDAEVLDHQNRMETLMRYADKLNGVVPKPADSSKLKIIFESFHPSHVMNYKLTGNKFTAATKLDDIIDFMKLQKHNQEMKASQFSKKRKGENDENYNPNKRNGGKRGGRGFQGRGKGGRGGNKPSYGKPHSDKVYNDSGQEMCSKHGHTHTRDHCFDNPHGSRFRGGGRGTSGGRGYQGRGYQGNGGGRGYQGRGSNGNGSQSYYNGNGNNGNNNNNNPNHSYYNNGPNNGNNNNGNNNNWNNGNNGNNGNNNNNNNAIENGPSNGSGPPNGSGNGNDHHYHTNDNYSNNNRNPYWG